MDESRHSAIGIGPVEIGLNDLPKYTNWPRRLLSLEAFDVKYKSEAEVVREYEHDKWGRLIAQVRAMSRPTVREVDRLFLDFEGTSPCYLAGSFYLATHKRMHDEHLELYSRVLKPYLAGASCLVELGAGYGSKLLTLAERDDFSSLPLVAAEYTQNGQDLISVLAASTGTSVAVGHCDFRTMKIEGVTIPENAVIFTSYAVHYVPTLSLQFVSFLKKLKPRVVVHFEPCYEHYETDTFHGLMCRRYVELNDYTRNLVTVIDAACARGEIAARMTKNVLGSNPFLPISVIEWAPAESSTIPQ